MSRYESHNRTRSVGIQSSEYQVPGSKPTAWIEYDPQKCPGYSVTRRRSEASASDRHGIKRLLGRLNRGR